QHIVIGVLHEVVFEGAILRPHLLGGAFRLRRSPVHVKTLMVVQARERRDAGGDGVVGARLHPDVMWWIRVDQVCKFALHQAVYILPVGRVPAQQQMISQDPKIASTRDGILEWLWAGVLVR